VLVLAADKNHWPLAIFTEGGPRPAEVLASGAASVGMVREPVAQYGGLQAAVNAALTDVVRWTAEGLTLEEAATRAIQLITSVAQAARREAATTARATDELVDVLRQRIGQLGSGRGAGSPEPPARAAGEG
jgi:hypothetical protein